MKFRINRDQFLTPLQLVSGAIERRHTLQSYLIYY